MSQAHGEFRVQRNICMLPDIISYMSIWSGSKKLNAAFDVHSAQTKIWYVTCEGGISQLCKLSCSVNVATLCTCVLPIRLSGLMGASAISCQYMIQGNFVCGWFVSVLRQPMWLVTKLEEQSKTIIFCCTMMTSQNHWGCTCTYMLKASTEKMAFSNTDCVTWLLRGTYLSFISFKQCFCSSKQTVDSHKMSKTASLPLPSRHNKKSNVDAGVWC